MKSFPLVTFVLLAVLSSTPFAVAQQAVNATFTVIREGGCTPLTALIRAPVEDDCMRIAVSDVLNNMASTVRYIGALDATNTEVEVAMGAVQVQGSVNDLNLNYACPPDGYNGFSVAAGSFCQVTPDTQLWATFTDFETGDLLQIRIILANEFPPVDEVEPDKPPFGTALLDIPQGLDLSSAAKGAELAFCPIMVDEAEIECPDMPARTGLGARFTASSFGYFGTDLLGDMVIPGPWYQDDEKQLLAGITSPSNVGGLQEFYFNASGFYLHTFADPSGGPETCIWLPFCDYACEVYNYDARFFDDLGEWKITWKLDQEKFDRTYSVDDPVSVRAYFGNAIDAAGIFPSLSYINVDNTVYLGLDKIGSANVTQQPGYAYYWYTDYTVGPPAIELLTPPEVCNSIGFVPDDTVVVDDDMVMFADDMVMFPEDDTVESTDDMPTDDDRMTNVTSVAWRKNSAMAQWSLIGGTMTLFIM